MKISKDILSQITGEEIKDFSLPYGQENGAILKEAKKYYKRIAISKPYFFKKESNILGRISIHSSNHFKHKWVKKVITNKFDLKYFLRIYIVNFIKKIIPNSIYLKIKNYFTFKKSIDVFGKNHS